MPDDLADYARPLVSARIPEMSAAEIVSALGGAPQSLPAEIADTVLDVIEAFEDKLAELEARLRLPP
jgi:hypothetical protein